MAPTLTYTQNAAHEISSLYKTCHTSARGYDVSTSKQNTGD